MNGQGVPKDSAKATEWLTKSKEQGGEQVREMFKAAGLEGLFYKQV
jgi:TPR repeat protein